MIYPKGHKKHLVHNILTTDFSLSCNFRELKWNQRLTWLDLCRQQLRDHQGRLVPSSALSPDLRGDRHTCNPFNNLSSGTEEKHGAKRNRSRLFLISSHSLSGTGCQQQFSRRARGSFAGSETHKCGLTGPNTPETDPGRSPSAPSRWAAHRSWVVSHSESPFPSETAECFSVIATGTLPARKNWIFSCKLKFCIIFYFSFKHIHTHTDAHALPHTQLSFICQDPATDGHTVWTLTQGFLTFFTGVGYSPAQTAALAGPLFTFLPAGRRHRRSAT